MENLKERGQRVKDIAAAVEQERERQRNLPFDLQMEMFAEGKLLMDSVSSEDIAQQYVNGESGDRGVLDWHLEVADPGYEPVSDFERRYQDAVLKGYTGDGWTPDQRDKLANEGRVVYDATVGVPIHVESATPGYKEMSPGKKMRSDFEARRDFIHGGDKGVFEKRLATAGPQSRMPDGDDIMGFLEFAGSKLKPLLKEHTNIPLLPFGDALLDQLPDSEDVRKTGYSGTNFVEDMENPETFLGYYNTRMGPVLSQVGSLIGDALLRNDETSADPVFNALANAEISRAASGANMTSPQLEVDSGWRENNKLIEDQGAAYDAANGLSGAEYPRQIYANMGKTYHRNPATDTLFGLPFTIGNSMLDGGTGAWDEVFGDGMMIGGSNAVNNVITAQQHDSYSDPSRDLTPEEIKQIANQKHAEQQRAFAEMNQNNHKFHTPITKATTNDTIKSGWDSVVSGLADVIEPVVGPVDEAVTYVSKNFKPPQMNLSRISR